MQISQIIAEANELVQNSFSDAQKVSWLNAINNEFFEVVKIPKSFSFDTVVNQSDYSIPNDVRARNVDKVQVGRVLHLNWAYENAPPGQSYFLIDEQANKIKLIETPTLVQKALIRYFRIATTTFTSGNLNVEPDAPPEYHWIYIPALAAYIARAMDDVAKANNYDRDYRSYLATAQQNFQQSG